MLLARTLQRSARRLAARSFAGIEKTLDGKRSTRRPHYAIDAACPKTVLQTQARPRRSRFIREQEKANKAKRDADVTEITTVGVVGLGLMGHGIAQISAAAGFQTVGVDLSVTCWRTARKPLKRPSRSSTRGKATKNRTSTPRRRRRRRWRA